MRRPYRIALLPCLLLAAGPAWSRPHIPFLKHKTETTEAPANTDADRGKAGRAGAGSDKVDAAGRKALRERQYAIALQQLGNGAAAGRADSEFLLGMVYLNGLGQAPDEAKAREWLQKAAAQQHGEAAFVLAELASRGDHPDAAAARDWLQKSAKAGYLRANDALKDPRPLLAPEREEASDAAVRNELALYAAANDDAELLTVLGAGAVSEKDVFGCSTLCTAAFSGSRNSVEWLLSQHADPQAADSFGVTPLMRAATLADPAIVSLLLAHGARVDSTDKEQRTALFYAARHDRADTVRALQKAGASLTAADSRGYGVLDTAVIADSKAAAAALREVGAKQLVSISRSTTVKGVDLTRPGVIYKGWSGAAMAASRDDVGQLRAQLAGSGNIGERTPQGDTLLHVALHAGANNALKFLVESGADPLAPDHRKRSPVDLAAADNNAAALTILLSKNPRAALGTSGGTPPLLVATEAGAMDAIKLLLAAGAIANAADPDGYTPLAEAATHGSGELVRMLLDRGAQLNQSDKAGHTALWLAARAGNIDALQQLLAARAPLEAGTADGQTPLMAAIVAGKPAAVKLLLAAGAQTDIRNKAGDTPLLLAAATGQLDLVQTLLARGNKVDAQNALGDTAIIAASRFGHVDVCRALLKAGASVSLRNGNRANAADTARDRGFVKLADELAGAG